MDTIIPLNQLDFVNSTCIPTSLSPLIPGIPDKYTVLILPVAAYWTFSLAFYFCDEYGLLAKYKLHTPAEFLQRNRVSVRDVVKEVITQHVIQTILGAAIAWNEPDELTGCEHRDVAAWALTIEQFVHSMSPFVAVTGIDLSRTLSAATSVVLAKTLYWVIIPFFQYALAGFFVDTWQYMIHRQMHKYQWLYRTFHARHHRLYVPYAFGALYNHPFEGFLEDTIGSLLAYKLARMTIRQGIFFFTMSTIKTVDDHSGFRLPWDPLQWITENNAYYHDIHHQSWGMKTNFSQPFTSFWDRVLGTRWAGSEQETQIKYKNGKAAAEKSAAFQST